MKRIQNIDIGRFWKFEFTNYTNVESSFKCTYSNNTSNASMPKLHSDEFFTLLKLVNSNFQKRQLSCNLVEI